MVSIDGNVIGTFGVSKDVTALKEAEARLEAANHNLMEVSRTAGMAEVACDVIHNVGNVLNRVNVSCTKNGFHDQTQGSPDSCESHPQREVCRIGGRNQ